MTKTFTKILIGITICLCISCKKTGSAPSVASNSVHSKVTGESKYDENQKGIVLGNNKVDSPIDNMRLKVINGIEYYFDHSSPKFSTKKCFYPYIKKSNGTYQILLRIRYVADEWLNTENVLLTVDNKDYSFKGDVIKSETKGKKVYKIELLEIPLKEDMLDVMEKVASGKEVIEVLIGDKKYEKSIMSEEQKLAFRNVLNAYNYLIRK